MCYFPLDCPNPESYVFRLSNDDDEIVLTDEILGKVHELCDSFKPKPKTLTNSHRRPESSSNEKDMLMEDYMEYQAQSNKLRVRSYVNPECQLS